MYLKTNKRHLLECIGAARLEGHVPKCIGVCMVMNVYVYAYVYV